MLPSPSVSEASSDPRRRLDERLRDLDNEEEGTAATDVPSSNLWDSDDTEDTDTDDEDELIDYFPGAGEKVGDGSDLLSNITASDKFKEERKVNLYYPFSCKMEWESVKWLSSLNVSMKRIDEYLKSDYVRTMRFSDPPSSKMSLP